jgi:hypothetical protein
MNGILKFIIYAAIFESAPYLLSGVHYQHMIVPFVLALFFAVIGHFADRWILSFLGNGRSTIAGTIFMITVMTGGSIWLPYWRIPLSIAAITGIVLGTVEWVMHRHLLSDRAIPHRQKKGGR